MRDLIIQGMRRTGTTILFDTFVRDPRFETYYEPFNAVPDAPSLGGGSGSHQIDLFAAVRRIRARFLAANPDVDPEILNHGGPTRPDVEVEAELGAIVDGYLAEVVGAPGPKAIKFVRMGAKIGRLAALAPDAVLAWPVRDPREVVRSYLEGRERRWADRYPSADEVFAASTDRDPWSVRRLSEAIVERDRLEFDRPLSDVERIVLVWADAVGTMEADGPRHFGERAVRVRHEDFCADPAAVLSALFERMDGVPDPESVRWCRDVVRPATRWHHALDPRWEAVFDRVGAAGLVHELGYL